MNKIKKLQQWMVANKGEFAPILGVNLDSAPLFDFSVAGEHAPSNAKIPNMNEFQTNVDGITAPHKPSIGRYLEPRLIYAGAAYFTSDHQASPRRCVHIAVDVFLPANTPVYAPYLGKVHSASIQNDDYDYGGLVTLEHQTPDGLKFYTLYGHLAWDEVNNLTIGQEVKTGEAFAKLGDYNQNGNWPPHVHFQLSVEDLDGKDWPGVVNPDEVDKWQQIFPDPAPLLNLNLGHCTSNVSPENGFIRHYEALKYDAWGRTYLDAFCRDENADSGQISQYIFNRLNRFDTEISGSLIRIHDNDPKAWAKKLFDRHMLVGQEPDAILIQIYSNFSQHDADYLLKMIDESAI